MTPAKNGAAPAAITITLSPQLSAAIWAVLPLETQAKLLNKLPEVSE